MAEQVARLRELRSQKPDPADLRARAVAAAYCDGSEEGKLRHRYEMAIDRSLRATIQQLIMLEKSGADLGQDESQVTDNEGDTSDTPAASEVLKAVAPGSVGAGDPIEVPTGSEVPKRGPEVPKSVPARAGGGRSRR